MQTAFSEALHRTIDSNRSGSAKTNMYSKNFIFSALLRKYKLQQLPIFSTNSQLK